MKNLETEQFEFFNLGKIPLVNNLNDSFDDSINCDMYDLSVKLNKKNNLVSLTNIIDPKLLFDKYLYISGTSQPFIEHCKSMYNYISNYIEIDNNDIIIDIGGNDGTLLKTFKSQIDKKSIFINVDPSNVVNLINDVDINIINGYFNSIDIEIIGGKAKLILSTNVFQHLKDIDSFVSNIKKVLSDDGIWCLEFPYWYESMETLQFDQIYHEHIYYYNVKPLHDIFDSFGLKIFNINHQKIHGGSLRLLISHKESKYTVDDTIEYYLKKETLQDLEFYKKWNIDVINHTDICKENIKNISNSHTIAAFGAAAKGCVFLNYLKLDYKTISYIIDDTIVKQSKYVPGTGLKIFSRDKILKDNPDYILILAHNFKDYIIESLRNYGYKNKFIVCLPKFEIIS